MIGRYPVMVVVVVTARMIVALCIITEANKHASEWIANYFYDFWQEYYLTNTY
ncbi:hypothetical protein BH09BAC3_BH09BAC3_11580 [soil metagenome]